LADLASTALTERRRDRCLNWHLDASAFALLQEIQDATGERPAKMRLAFNRVLLPGEMPERRATATYAQA
jgi:hypothetical protein